MLAHPLRSRVLTLLRTEGPASATALALALGTNSGATSYHLRRLESVGLVADTGTGRGRTRIWRATDPAGPVAPDAPDVNTRVALSWIERDYVRHVSDKAEEWLDVAPAWPAAWASQLGMRDAVVLVTHEQLAALRADLAQVLTRYRRLGQGSPQAKRVAVYTYAYPVDFAAPGSHRGP
jgi:predicted ArsR family transcriptional regulator